MNVPDYGDIGGPAQTNDQGQHYKIAVQPDSQGNPGIWHVYFNGNKVFLASPAASPSASVMPGAVSGVPAGVDGSAPAPAPAPPVQPNGGVQAPDTSQPAGATLVPVSVGTAVADAPQQSVPTASAGGDSSQGTTGTDADGHTWLENSETGKHYYEQPGHDSHNNPGTWHVYRDGSKQFVAEGSTIEIVDNSFNDGNSLTMSANSSTSSTGSQNADGLHGASGFSGQARELHTSSDVTGGMQVAPTAEAQPASASGGANADGAAYTVVTGDNMWNIAQAHNMSLDQLQALNPQIEHPELILPGQQINIGAGGDIPAVPTETPAAFPTTSSYETPTAVPQDTDNHGVGGWTDGTSAIPNDPTHGIASSGMAQVQTDPLKINDDQHES